MADIAKEGRMTTPRTRRTKPQQARVILLALLKDQEAEAAKHKAAHGGAELRATSTRRAIELLDQAMLSGMELRPEPPIGLGPTAPPDPSAHPITGGAGQTGFLTDSEGHVQPRLHRQRIGEKATSACAHEHTGIVDGVRRCVACNERVF